MTRLVKDCPRRPSFCRSTLRTRVPLSARALRALDVDELDCCGACGASRRDRGSGATRHQTPPVLGPHPASKAGACRYAARPLRDRPAPAVEPSAGATRDRARSLHAVTVHAAGVAMQAARPQVSPAGTSPSPESARAPPRLPVLLPRSGALHVHRHTGPTADSLRPSTTRPAEFGVEGTADTSGSGPSPGRNPPARPLPSGDTAMCRTGRCGTAQFRGLRIPSTRAARPPCPHGALVTLGAPHRRLGTDPPPGARTRHPASPVQPTGRGTLARQRAAGAAGTAGTAQAAGVAVACHTAVTVDGQPHEVPKPRSS